MRKISGQFPRKVSRNFTRKNILNESTTGADASVEMPKLRNIKLLIAFMHMINNLILLHAKTQRVGNDRP